MKWSISDFKEAADGGNSKARMGTRISKFTVVLTAVESMDNKCRVTLKDATSEISGIVSCKADELAGMVGKPVYIDGAVWSNGEENFLGISSIIEAAPNTFNLLELYGGISDETRASYIEEMRVLIKSVESESYRNLLIHAFDKERLSKYETLPATLIKHGAYSGGLLASVVSITKMALAMAGAYDICGNGLYSKSVNRDLIIVSGLLLGYGSLLYREPESPWQKTFVGVQLGPQRCEQKLLDTLIKEKELSVSEMEMVTIYNVQSEAFELRTGVKTTTKEGKFLAAAYRTYSICDGYDYALEEVKANGTEEDLRLGYAFSEKLNSYITLPAREEIND